MPDPVVSWQGELSMMTIAFQCRCGQRLKAKDGSAGKTVTCPACGEPVTVPGARGRPDDRAGHQPGPGELVPVEPDAVAAVDATPQPPAAPMVEASVGGRLDALEAENRRLRKALRVRTWCGVAGLAVLALFAYALDSSQARLAGDVFALQLVTRTVLGPEDGSIKARVLVVQDSSFTVELQRVAPQDLVSFSVFDISRLPERS